MRTTRLDLEVLEDRCVPATWGIPWPNPSQITFSFVPDGTSLGNQNSNLFQTLNAEMPQSVWQHDIAAALQTWAQYTNINFGLVADQGLPEGTAGRPQGDPRFGDIRISGAALSPNLVAEAGPYDVSGDTWAGDIVFNTSMNFGPGGYDLYSVALHEIGHSLGFADNADPTSVENETYSGVRTGLGAGDIAGLQALYGPRSSDPYQSANLSQANNLGLLTSSGGALALQVNGNLNAIGDTDFFQFTAPSLTGGLTVSLHKSGLSLLTPEVTVFNAQGKVVASGESTDPLGGDLTLQINNVTPLGKYYVEVQGATGTAFDVGTYQMSIQSLPVVNQLTGSLGSLLGKTTSTVVNTLPLNGTFLTATPLSGSLLAPGAPSQIAYTSGITFAGQVAYYQLQAPTSSSSSVMTVTAWGLTNGGLVPHVTVFDANQNPVSAQVLVNENGIDIIQVNGVTAGAKYYVRVDSSAQGAQGLGGYFLGINFGSVAVQLNTYAQGTLNAQQSSIQGQLNVQQNGVFHFILGAGNTPGEQVTLTITNSSGQVVGSITSPAGQSISLTLMLAPGLYSTTISAQRSDGSPLSDIAFILQGSRLGDRQGPQPEDPTSAPTTSPSSTPTTTSSGSTTGPTSTAGSSTTTPTSSTPSSTSTTPSSSSDASDDYYWYWSSSSTPSSSGPSPSNPSGTGYTT